MSEGEKHLETRIDGIDVDLDIYIEDGGQFVSQCFLTKKVRGKEFTCSLALAESFGYIENDMGESVQVDQSTMEKITDWALTNGY